MDEPESEPGTPAPELQGPLARPRKVRWPFVVLLVILLFVLVGFGVPLFVYDGGDHGHERTECIMHAKQIGLALYSFRQDYGQYPCDGTIPLVKQHCKDPDVSFGDQTANHLLRQLLVAGFVEEEYFHVPGCMTRRPDNDMKGSKMLEAGECGLAYVVWEGDQEPPPSAPLLLVPVIPGQKGFDVSLIKRLYGQSVIILHADNSITLQKMDGKGRILMGDGSDFFDWSQPHWGGRKPRLAWPE